MKRRESGFTLIEVAIFLAVTGALFVAITVGVQNSIYQQRYNDTVQNFADFLSNLYSEVLNVQSEGDGRSGEAIYGKLVTFGSKDAENKQVVYAYNVIAKAINTWDSDYSANTTVELLKNLGANVVRKNDDGNGYVPIGMVEEYTPRWAARIQNTTNYEDYTGSLLILRSAQTGTVRTYVSNETIDVNDKIKNSTGDGLNIFVENERNLLDSFKSGQVDFCVNPNGDEASNTRMDVRLVEGARDASGIEIISFDNEGYRCRVEGQD